jgi:hypothetical protein
LSGDDLTGRGNPPRDVNAEVPADVVKRVKERVVELTALERK